MEEITIGITDDDALIVNLLHPYLHNAEGMNVLFTANSGEELLEKLSISEKLPQVLLLDLKMKGMDGIAVTEHLKQNYPDIKIIVISSHYQKSFMGFMVKTGVSAFLPKGVMPIELITIIKAVHIQGFYFKEEQLEVLRNQIAVKTPKPILDDNNVLSERETEILQLICQQKTAKEIGDTIYIAQRTVEGHKNNLFTKTGAKNIAGLVIYALQRGIIKVEELPVI